MPVKTVISTDKAPAAVGPYSQGIAAGDLVFISGQIPLDPETGRLVPGDLEIQVRRVLKNLKAVLAEAGCGLSDVVRLEVFLVDLGGFPTVNRVMKEYFPESPPARATVQVSALPLGAGLEVAAIALRP